MSRAVSTRPIDRTYKSAVEILRGRVRPGRPTAASASGVPQNAANTSKTPGLRGTPSIVGMEDWLRKIGHSTSDIDKLNIIHVAGTKGKGSTCAFVESFLRTFGERTGFPKKTGLYTSPHLIYPEERIRINFKPIERDLFAKYFFEVWDAVSSPSSPNGQGPVNIPRHLQLYALVSFHAFIREGVEATVVETHHGGEFDATNFIKHPVATVVTTLGMDHVQQLGPTIGNIAWHKAGIFKPGALAISSPQEPAAAEVIRERAAEKGVEVQFVEPDPSLPEDAVQLTPDVQRINSSVALAAARGFLLAKGSSDTLSRSDIAEAVNGFSWPGRFQFLAQGKYRWYLDGAHNEMSVQKAAEWFTESSKSTHTSKRILIFSQVSEHRDSAAVLEQLATALSDVKIDHVIFTLYSPQQDLDAGTVPPPLPEYHNSQTQEIFGLKWQTVHSQSHIHYEPDVQSALETAKRIGQQDEVVHTLITGSQHLIGAALHTLHRSS